MTEIKPTTKKVSEIEGVFHTNGWRTPTMQVKNVLWASARWKQERNRLKRAFFGYIINML